jgi:hypothetical protein
MDYFSYSVSYIAKELDWSENGLPKQAQNKLGGYCHYYPVVCVGKRTWLHSHEVLQVRGANVIGKMGFQLGC